MSNQEVRTYWEKEPCGTSPVFVGEGTERTQEWFEKIEEHRYNVEPFIHSIAQFTRQRGKKILEIGVGAGTDHLQWARAGVKCFGVDLTQAAIDVTKERFALYGLHSDLKRVDAEKLPFADDEFEVVYSWGVIHHSDCPENVIREIFRVLKPGGMFIGMMYGRHSLLSFRKWVKHGLLKGRPSRSFTDVIWHHVESIGTKSHTLGELKDLFSCFNQVTAKPFLTQGDTHMWPQWVCRFFPDSWGFYITLRAII